MLGLRDSLRDSLNDLRGSSSSATSAGQPTAGASGEPGAGDAWGSWEASVQPGSRLKARFGLGRIVVSETELPNLLVNLI